MFEYLIVTCTLFSLASISSARLPELLVGRSEVVSTLVLVCRKGSILISFDSMGEESESPCGCDRGRTTVDADVDVESISVSLGERMAFAFAKVEAEVAA
mmetsp:Transcript_9350/g.17602  ORF Transcript_9350/g.17602 Transcript_9350/m.17602 type:complete len:100 (+) Transcript_9350:30-329(+)